MVTECMLSESLTPDPLSPPDKTRLEFQVSLHPLANWNKYHGWIIDDYCSTCSNASTACKNPWDCVYRKIPQAVPSLKRQGLASNLPLSLAEGMNCGRLGCRQWVH